MSESDSGFFRTFILVLVLLIVFMAVIIFLANKISIGEKDNKDSRVQAQINNLIKPVGEVATTASETSSAPAAGGAIDGKAVFQKTCFACHGMGVAGAPKAGDKAAWKSHIDKGMPTLYKHAIHGFTGKAGVMPAKGGNPALSDAEVEAGVNYMVGLVAPNMVKKVEAATKPKPAASTGGSDLALGKSTFQKTCFACHGMGVAGAPKAGDKAAWAPHVAKGKPTLYKHALNGFTGKKGVMPAKGGNPALSDTQVKAAVDYMLSLVK